MAQITCPLCLREFDGDIACKGCGLVKSCRLLKCPHCGYEFAERSKIMEFLKRLFGRKLKRRQSHERQKQAGKISPVP